MRAAQFVGLPLDTCVDRERRNGKAQEAKGERQAVRAGDIEQKTAEPCAESASHAEADLQKAENDTDPASGEDIGYNSAVGRITGAMTDRVNHGGEINKPHG